VQEPAALLPRVSGGGSAALQPQGGVGAQVAPGVRGRPAAIVFLDNPWPTIQPRSGRPCPQGVHCALCPTNHARVRLAVDEVTPNRPRIRESAITRHQPPRPPKGSPALGEGPAPVCA